MRLIDNEEAIVKGLVDPVTINVLFRSAQALLNIGAEGLIGHELVKFIDDAVGGTLEFVANAGYIPVGGFRFNPEQHVQIPPARALLGFQSSGDGVDAHPFHLEQLGAEVLLDCGRGNDHDPCILEFGTHNILFRHLNGCARLARSRSMDEQEVAIGTVGRQDATQKALLRLELEAPGRAYSRTLVGSKVFEGVE